MQLEIILEPDLPPSKVTEIAVAAENYGFRTLWHSNYHQNPDAFMMLVPAALVTKRIKLGTAIMQIPARTPPFRHTSHAATPITQTFGTLFVRSLYALENLYEPQQAGRTSRRFLSTLIHFYRFT